MHQSADGGWVLIGDYSCLKSEAHILRLTCQDLQAKNARLKAEVERLRKAGDGVLNSLDLCYMGKKLHLLPSVIEWNAAKEGKQS